MYTTFLPLPRRLESVVISRARRKHERGEAVRYRRDKRDKKKKKPPTLYHPEHTRCSGGETAEPASVFLFFSLILAAIQELGELAGNGALVVPARDGHFLTRTATPRRTSPAAIRKPDSGRRPCDTLQSGPSGADLETADGCGRVRL